MKIYFTGYSLNIFKREIEKWEHPEHTHNFYELILVNEGCGIHHINNVSFEFQKGDIFLLSPRDSHHFTIHAISEFTFIKFTEVIFEEKLEWANKKWQEKTQNIINQYNVTPKNIVQNPTDRKLIFELSEALMLEFKQTTLFTRELSLEIFGTIFLLILRNLVIDNFNISDIKPEAKNKVTELLTYIRNNIGNKKEISQKKLAQIFQLSPNYISDYIKKHTGNNLQNMITQTRINKAEQLLKQSNFTIYQIAEKVGFNDTSHMNKIFLKYKNKNPSKYR